MNRLNQRIGAINKGRKKDDHTKRITRPQSARKSSEGVSHLEVNRTSTMVRLPLVDSIILNERWSMSSSSDEEEEKDDTIQEEQDTGRKLTETTEDYCYCYEDPTIHFLFHPGDPDPTILPGDRDPTIHSDDTVLPGDPDPTILPGDRDPTIHSDDTILPSDRDPTIPLGGRDPTINMGDTILQGDRDSTIYSGDTDPTNDVPVRHKNSESSAASPKSNDKNQRPNRVHETESHESFSSSSSEPELEETLFSGYYNVATDREEYYQPPLHLYRSGSEDCLATTGRITVETREKKDVRSNFYKRGSEDGLATTGRITVETREKKDVRPNFYKRGSEDGLVTTGRITVETREERSSAPLEGSGGPEYYNLKYRHHLGRLTPARSMYIKGTEEHVSNAVLKRGKRPIPTARTKSTLSGLDHRNRPMPLPRSREKLQTHSPPRVAAKKSGAGKKPLTKAASVCVESQTTAQKQKRSATFHDDRFTRKSLNDKTDAVISSGVGKKEVPSA